MTAHRDALVARVTAVLAPLMLKPGIIAERIIDDIVLAPLPVDDRAFIEDSDGRWHYLAPDSAEVASMTFIAPGLAEDIDLDMLGGLFKRMLDLLSREAETRDRAIDQTRVIAVQCRAHTVGKRGLL